MAKFISRNNPVSANTLKRKPVGTVAFHHNGSYEDVRFTRVHGGWARERVDIFEQPTVVSSAVVANECNHAFGCRESWAEVY